MPLSRVLLEKLTITQPVKKRLLLWYLKVHYCVYSSAPVVTVLNQMNSFSDRSAITCICRLTDEQTCESKFHYHIFMKYVEVVFRKCFSCFKCYFL